MDLRKIDALIAEHVMGCKVYEVLDYGVEGNRWFRCDCPGANSIDERPHANSDSFDGEIKIYSSDIYAAWDVAEKLRAEGLYFEIHNDKAEWSLTGYDGYNAERKSGVDGSARTAPLAICLAALKSKGIKV